MHRFWTSAPSFEAMFATHAPPCPPNDLAQITTHDCSKFSEHNLKGFAF
jgi:hypothetical protein